MLKANLRFSYDYNYIIVILGSMWHSIRWQSVSSGNISTLPENHHPRAIRFYVLLAEFRADGAGMVFRDIPWGCR